MCGIAGIVPADPDLAVSEQALLAMGEALWHRGPDDAGHYLAPGVGLVARRLAILDLSSRGHMPMSTADGRYHIVYNGEVYNCRELRLALMQRGQHFHSQTDTEVLLHQFAADGPAMLDRLNGMFACAIWDSHERALFLARDRLGIKPLYYALWHGVLYFSSEEKGLFAAGVPASFDQEAWDELLCFRYVAGERTPFSGVRRLLPGHSLMWQGGRLQVRRWWCLGERVRTLREQSSRAPEKVRAWFGETLQSAVALHAVADVPVGVLLSGGLDSSSIAVLLAKQLHQEIASFTVRFAEAGHDEGPLARQVARHAGLAHHELWLPDRELLPWLQQAAWHGDGPPAHASDPHLLAIAQSARLHVKVLLSGEGADEQLCGYVRYQPLRHPLLMHALRAARRLLPRQVHGPDPGHRLRKLGRLLSLPHSLSWVMLNACEVFPDDLLAAGLRPAPRFPFREQVLAEARALYPGEPVRQAMYGDQHTFLCSLLDRNDRMTMAASIECRVPFLDHRLVEGLAALPTASLLPGTHGKQLLRDATGPWLPGQVLRQRKWGFGVPWARYLRRAPALREVVRALPDQPVIREGPLDRQRVSALVTEFLAGDPGREALISQLVMIAVWHEAYFTRLRHLRRPGGQEWAGPRSGEMPT